MRGKLTLAFLGLLLVTPALAQPASDAGRLALGEQVYDLTHSANDASAILSAMPSKPAATPAAQAQRDAAMQRASEMVRNLEPITRKAYAKAYAAHFTLAELQGLISFYKSPLGIRLTSQRTQIDREVMRETMPQIMARAQAAEQKK